MPRAHVTLFMPFMFTWVAYVNINNKHNDDDNDGTNNCVYQPRVGIHDAFFIQIIRIACAVDLIVMSKSEVVSHFVSHNCRRGRWKRRKILSM